MTIEYWALPELARCIGLAARMRRAFCLAWSGKARQGEAWRGRAWSGEAWLGQARRGRARPGVARPGGARRGWAGLGPARFGRVWFLFRRVSLLGRIWMYVNAKCRITGAVPLLMHNAQLADPLNEFTRAIKAICAKGKKKTDADLEELARLEFMGGLYLDANGHPAIPGECIEGMVRNGARKSRQGKDVECGVISDGTWPLIYDGPKTAEKLWENHEFRDYRGCGVQKSRVMRMRPKFSDWALEFELSYLPEIANASSVRKWLEDAGIYVGLLDFRPRFGRFVVDSID